MDSFLAPPWLEAFPKLRAVDDELGRRVIRNASRVTILSEGSTVFSEGDACEGYLLCVSGSVRVYKNAPQGRELTLYRVRAGTTCAITTACLLSGKPYPANSITETVVEAVVISKMDFRLGVAGSPGFSDFVFTGFGDQLTVLFGRLQGLAFDRIDVRIAESLLSRIETDGEVVVTHKQLATEIGSVREVVTRELKAFKARGWIEVHRGRIIVHDANALTDLILHNML